MQLDSGVAFGGPHVFPKTSRCASEAKVGPGKSSASHPIYCPLTWAQWQQIVRRNKASSSKRLFLSEAV